MRAALGCALALSACLVTQEVRYEDPETIPRVARRWPETAITRVPSFDDPLCAPGEARFEVKAAFRDTGEDLWYSVFVLGRGVQHLVPNRVRPPPDRPEQRIVRACVPKLFIDDSGESCKVLTVVLSGSFETLRALETYDPLNPAPDTVAVEWQVLPSAAVDPELSPNACAEAQLRDAGPP